MAALRKLKLTWELTSGRLKCSTCYLKRNERVDVELSVLNSGEAYDLPAGWGVVLTLKPQSGSDADPLTTITGFAETSTVGLYSATSQLIGSTALDEWLEVNADSDDDVESKYVDIDVYYSLSTVTQAKSDTLTLTLKPDVGRAEETSPTVEGQPIPAFSIEMQAPGSAEADLELGTWWPVVDSAITELQVHVRQESEDDMVIDLFADGVRQYRSVTLTAGLAKVHTVFDQPLNVDKDAEIVAKVISAGETGPGFVQVRLMYQLGSVAVGDQPDGAMVDRDGNFILDRDGNYILTR